MFKIKDQLSKIFKIKDQQTRLLKTQDQQMRIRIKTSFKTKIKTLKMVNNKD